MTRPWMSRPCTPRPGLIERCLSRPVGVAVRRIAGVPVSSTEEAALKSLATLLGRALDGYRQREVRRLIELAHDDVDTSLVLLERLAALKQALAALAATRNELDAARVALHRL